MLFCGLGKTILPRVLYKTRALICSPMAITTGTPLRISLLKSASGRKIGADPAVGAGLKGQEPDVALGGENYDFGVGTNANSTP